MSLRTVLFFMVFCTHFHFLIASEYQINAGPLFNFARYNLGTLPKIQGYLAGIHTDFKYCTQYNIYTALQFNARWNAGFICGDQDTKIQIKDYRPELFLGYNWCACEDFYLTPFTGLGLYYLSNELKPNIMTYRYFALFPPVGLSLNWDVRPDCFDVGLIAWYRPYVWRKLKIEVPCIDTCETEKIDLKYSQGLHIKIPLTWKISCYETFDVQCKVVPFLDWNHFARSSEKNSNCIPFEIPKLKQWYLGLHIDLGFCF